MTAAQIQEILSRPTTTVDNAGRILGLGRNSAYERVRAGEIPSIKMGRRVLVLTAPLRKMLAGEAA